MRLLKNLMKNWNNPNGSFPFNNKGTWVAVAIVAGGGALVGAHQSRKERKRAEELAARPLEHWRDYTAPQKEYLRQRYPMELEMLESYMPYYKKQIEAGGEMLGYPKEMMETYMPYYKEAIGAQRETLPLTTGMREQYAPYYQEAISEARKLLPYPAKMTGKAFEDILGYQEPGVQPWEKQAVSAPFARARETLGERTAGRGTMRAGTTQKLATLYDIAEAEALAKLPFQREQAEKEKKMALMMQFLGYAPGGAGAPTAPAIPTMGAPAIPGAARAPGSIGVSTPGIPGLPTGNLPSTTSDWGAVMNSISPEMLANIMQ